MLRIEEIVRPAKLGEPLQILFESNLRFEDFYVELSDPNFPLYERSVFKDDWITIFYRFLLSPWNHEVWANLPRAKRIASEMPFHPKQTVNDNDPPQASDAPRP
ncbi:MAG: hypothetical protein U0795_19610 [Pirellulales bacterium]